MEEVREEARRHGVDLEALQVRLHVSGEAQRQVLDVLIAVLRQQGTTPESVRRLLERFELGGEVGRAARQC
jgi:hypothetical protein